MMPNPAKPPGAVKRMSLLLCLLILSSTLLSCSHPASLPSSQADVRLDDTVALVYYSTSLPKEYYNKGTSYLVRMNVEGSIQTLLGEGLEWGSPVKLPEQDSLIIQRKRHIEVQTNEAGSASYVSPCSVSAGYRQMSGYLTGSKQYYSLFNQGVAPNDDYVSILRWGDSNHHYCREIREFVEAQGSDGHMIYALTSDHASLQGLSLIAMEPRQDNLISATYPLLDMDTGSLIVQTDIVSVQGKLYAVFSTRTPDNRVKLQLMEIDTASRTACVYPLHTYGEELDNRYFSLSANSLGVTEGKLYYVDGYGTVFPFALDTRTAGSTYPLAGFEPSSDRNHEMGYARGNYFYLFRYDAVHQAHKVEQYRLADGSLQQELRIPKVKDAISPEVYLYDFQMLSDL
ncbi:MAG: hypothetical protein E6230_01730 [Paenibacillus dendritiformis]|uniref:hypothetical protein n=1 Tax=uncultured Paenibacillus sp. TaxID=227322 RepID=UPI0025E2550C|nr:hypothetical protein [uncultured Paenibacillus sp.]MDU5140889.1 hypothetical protein [Paenibacillus dendritiformis]